MEFMTGYTIGIERTDESVSSRWISDPAAEIAGTYEECLQDETIVEATCSRWEGGKMVAVRWRITMEGR